MSVWFTHSRNLHNDVADDKRRSTKKRTVTLEVRLTPISISTNQYTAKDFPPTISLHAIEAKERGERITPFIGD